MRGFFKFLNAHTTKPVRVVPPFVKFFLKFLIRQVLVSRHHACNMQVESLGTAPRFDAQASAEERDRRLVAST